MEKHKVVANELAYYQLFLLCVRKEGFNQGIRQAIFFHGIPIDDKRYDVSKDIINGELVSVGGDDEEEG